MRLFECQRCGQLLDFENTWCQRCGLSLGYLPDTGVLSALQADGAGNWSALAEPGSVYRYCLNNEYAVCNWLVPAASADLFCLACQLNQTIPDLDQSRRVLLWRRLEVAKHRLVDGLLSLGLPLEPWTEPGGLGFAFLDPAAAPSGSDLVTSGHRGGLITIDINEADDAWREASRVSLAEPYRTLLGHMRHEVGHYYWDRLIMGSDWYGRFRDTFGSETEDYDESLQRHYIEGPTSDWNERYITPYAGMHPWEDWAETWAHYLHILDTLHTAYSFGLSQSPRHGRDPSLSAMQNLDPYGPIDLDALISRWLPLVYAGNRLSRSMGQPDLYPFILTPAVIEKLRFVHEVMRQSGVGSVRTR